ncbi:hypothetical protein [Vogesella sp. XCS3]|uniref:hypothetical protein n=1 Tax=Vogesella sp. XCS3 TaxID=2877939 RepID=UPI001D0B57E0|nr:hypothetical protein [Vogesella sp. XCS3]UDM17881.1 hypothetical protein LCH97_04240 [Vogesella sp. XCS3]
MKERPILFSGAMIRAILAGQKTQTRSVVKPIPQMVTDKSIVPWEGDAAALMRLFDQVDRVCPYGQPGDRLWVREAWKAHTTFDHLPPRDIPRSHIWYLADSGYKAESRTRASMHMPRWASRILLEIVSVRVERLQDISEADAEAEGIDFLRHIPDADETLTARDLYECLWDGINGEGSWAANPWVWVVEFKRVEGQPR